MTQAYTVSQAARVLGVTRLTIYQWIYRGKLPARRTLTRFLIAHEEIIKLKMSVL